MSIASASNVNCILHAQSAGVSSDLQHVSLSDALTRPVDFDTSQSHIRAEVFEFKSMESTSDGRCVLPIFMQCEPLEKTVALRVFTKSRATLNAIQKSEPRDIKFTNFEVLPPTAFSNEISLLQIDLDNCLTKLWLIDCRKQLPGSFAHLPSFYVYTDLGSLNTIQHVSTVNCFGIVIGTQQTESGYVFGIICSGAVTTPAIVRLNTTTAADLLPRQGDIVQLNAFRCEAVRDVFGQRACLYQQTRSVIGIFSVQVGDSLLLIKSSKKITDAEESRASASRLETKRHVIRLRNFWSELSQNVIAEYVSAFEEVVNCKLSLLRDIETKKRANIILQVLGMYDLGPDVDYCVLRCWDGTQLHTEKDPLPKGSCLAPEVFDSGCCASNVKCLCSVRNYSVAKNLNTVVTENDFAIDIYVYRELRDAALLCIQPYCFVELQGLIATPVVVQIESPVPQKKSVFVIKKTAATEKPKQLRWELRPGKNVRFELLERDEYEYARKLYERMLLPKMNEWHFDPTDMEVEEGCTAHDTEETTIDDNETGDTSESIAHSMPSTQEVDRRLDQVIASLERDNDDCVESSNNTNEFPGSITNDNRIDVFMESMPSTQETDRRLTEVIASMSRDLAEVSPEPNTAIEDAILQVTSQLDIPQTTESQQTTSTYVTAIDESQDSIEIQQSLSHSNSAASSITLHSRTKSTEQADEEHDASVVELGGGDSFLLQPTSLDMSHSHSRKRPRSQSTCYSPTVAVKENSVQIIDISDESQEKFSRNDKTAHAREHRQGSEDGLVSMTIRFVAVTIDPDEPLSLLWYLCRDCASYSPRCQDTESHGSHQKELHFRFCAKIIVVSPLFDTELSSSSSTGERLMWINHACAERLIGCKPSRLLEALNNPDCADRLRVAEHLRRCMVDLLKQDRIFTVKAKLYSASFSNAQIYSAFY